MFYTEYGNKHAAASITWADPEGGGVGQWVRTPMKKDSGIILITIIRYVFIGRDESILMILILKFKHANP